jgi:perosamine synthetase
MIMEYTQINIANPIIHYGHQCIDEEDIVDVVDVLRSDWLTTGPRVSEFEQSIADYVGAEYVVAVNSGTAALHAAMFALGVGKGDEVIVPTMTFAATANCVVYQGATPVFVDVEPDTLLIDPADVEKKITSRTMAIIGVDYAGQPCDWDALHAIAERHDLFLVDDGCHALGAEYKGHRIGAVADVTVFSFHPVKHITTGEGGAVTTNRVELAERLKRFRNHGIDTDHHQRKAKGAWYYEMTSLGYNYRLTDFQCALGQSQLKKLPQFLERRNQIAKRYDAGFKDVSGIKTLARKEECIHAHHLYVLCVNSIVAGIDRNELYQDLISKGIGTNVHYIPVHLHPYYRESFATKSGMCPAAEMAFERILSLPIHPAMTNDDVQMVIREVCGAVSKI